MKAEITPDVLRWARRRAGVSAAALARKVGVTAERYLAWEEGETLPTLRQAKMLADRLYTPLGYLYLDAPPEQELPLPDFRTVGSREVGAPSVNLLAVLHDALRKQQWYREHRLSLGAGALPFVGRYELDGQAPEVVGDAIREALAVAAEQREARSWEDFLRRSVKRAEALGITVLRRGIVDANTHRPLDVDELRGFAISDPVAPMVLINTRDGTAAQVFTLFHELAHVWLGKSGVSNLDVGSETAQTVERYCNAAAARALIPPSELRASWRQATSVDDGLQRGARRFRVSAQVVLRRALDLELIDRPTFSRHLARLRAAFERREKPKSRGGGGYRASLARNGRALTAAVIGSVLEGRLLHREAANLLGIKKMSTLYSLAEHLEAT